VGNDNRNYLVEPGTKERWMISLPSDSICILDPSLDMYSTILCSIHPLVGWVLSHLAKGNSGILALALALVVVQGFMERE
jgi:hypothetical protein